MTREEETKEVKIEIPQGYEIDKEKSTFEKIIFKKISENPKTWEEYCKLTKGIYSNYANATTNMVYKDRHTGAYNEFTTKERAEQFIALGKLLQLRDYWVGDWKRNSDNIYIIYKNVIMDAVHNNDFPLAFPTREMAEEFKDCFSDLIKQAYPLV